MTPSAQTRSGAASVGAAPELFGTETMAELCARQGRIGDAIAIYRQLLGRANDGARASRYKERLTALERSNVTHQPGSSAEQAGSPDARPKTPPPGAVARSGTPPFAPAELVIQPVRSGQVVDAGTRDLVVLGPVNPGAQLFADGHIHVYGPLRGRAVAGARGCHAARIFCLRLEAELVGIGTNLLSYDDIPAACLGKPAQVYLQDGRCVIAPL